MSSAPMVLYATPFREVPGTRNRRGFGDAMSSAQDGLNQLAPLQVLIDQSPSGAEATDNAQAAMLALTADLNAIKTAGPTDVFAPAPTFNSGSFLAGLGLALVGSALLYLAIDNSSPQRRPSRRRRTA